TRDRDENDVMFKCLQRLVAEAHGGHRAGPEILQHDIRFSNELGKDVLSWVAAQVEANRFLATVVNREINALATHKWGICAGFLAADALDLDDLCAEVRQHHAAARPRLKSRQLQHAHAVETEFHDLLANTYRTFDTTSGTIRAALGDRNDQTMNDG